MTALSPAYYHRQYENDFPKEKEPEEPSLLKRITLTALPFIALYGPLGQALSISLGSIRGASNFRNTLSSLKKGEMTTATYSLISATLATLSVANSIFKHTLGLTISTSSDMLSDLYHIAYALKEKNLSLAFHYTSEFLSSSLYLGILLSPSIELILASLLLQALFELYRSYGELTKGHLMEALAKVAMSSIRSYQATPYLIACQQKYKNSPSSFFQEGRSTLANCFHRYARFLAKPFWWYSKKMFQTISPLTSKEGSWQRTSEIARRTIFGVLSLPMIPITLVLAGLEMIPRTVASTINSTPYTILKGDAKEKTLPEDKTYSLFNLNTCFVAGGFSTLYGGVGPWEERIKGVIHLLKENNPDVICLQEVNDLDAAYGLYEELKSDYAHFAINIGPKIFAQNSGLFVASKYNTKEFRFESFEKIPGVQQPVNKGVLDFKIFSNDLLIGHIFTTHLSPSKDDFAPTKKEETIRKEEIQRIVANMEKIKDEAPKILVGDMNIDWRSSEYKTAFTSFHDSYNQDRKKIDPKEETCLTDYLIKKRWNYNKKEAESLDPNKYALILDYALSLNGEEQKAPSIKTKLIPTFTDENPLSDHGALFSTVQIKDLS